MLLKIASISLGFLSKFSFFSPIISSFVAADDNSFYSYDQFVCATSLQSSSPIQQPPSNQQGGHQQPPSTGNQQSPSNQQPPSTSTGNQPLEINNLQ